MRRDLYVSEAATVDAVKIGFAALGQQMRDLKSSVGWLVCDTKSALGGMIRDVIGTQAAAALEKGNMVPINGLGSLSFYSSRAFPNRAAGAVILACHPSAKLLDQLDRLRDAAALIVLPWTLDDIRNGRRPAVQKTFSASRPCQPLRYRIRSLPERWNRSITESMSQQVSVIRDRDAVIDAFRILRDANEAVDPRQVRAWLIQKGMEASNADDIAAIAENPGKFRRKSSRGSWAANILAQWRGE